MTPSLTPVVTPKRVRPPKCDRNVNLHLPEALYDDLVQLARMDQRTPGEYLRKVLECHVYGALSVYRG